MRYYMKLSIEEIKQYKPGDWLWIEMDDFYGYVKLNMVTDEFISFDTVDGKYSGREWHFKHYNDSWNIWRAYRNKEEAEGAYVCINRAEVKQIVAQFSDGGRCQTKD